MNIKNYAILLLLSLFAFSSCIQSSSNNDNNNKGNKNKANTKFETKEEFDKKAAKKRTNTKVITKDNVSNLDYARGTRKLKPKNEYKNVVGYNFDLVKSRSKVNFVGKKFNGSHKGYFPITAGFLKTDKLKNLIGGKFTIDLAAVTITDLKGKSKMQLENHLKSADFFNTKKNRFAYFEIVNLKRPDENSGRKFDKFDYIVEGNLEMNGITKAIIFNMAFKANVEGQSKGRAKVTIDRTQWGLHYGKEKSLKDKFIYPKVDLTIDIGAKLRSRGK